MSVEQTAEQTSQVTRRTLLKLLALLPFGAALACGLPDSRTPAAVAGQTALGVRASNSPGGDAAAERGLSDGELEGGVREFDEVRELVFNPSWFPSHVSSTEVKPAVASAVGAVEYEADDDSGKIWRSLRVKGDSHGNNEFEWSLKPNTDASGNYGSVRITITLSREGAAVKGEETEIELWADPDLWQKPYADSFAGKFVNWSVPNPRNGMTWSEATFEDEARKVRREVRFERWPNGRHKLEITKEPASPK